MATAWKRDYFRYRDFFLNVRSIYNLKPNLKIYLELALSLTTIVIFSFFAIKPTVLTIIELNKEIKGKEKTLTLLKQKVKNLRLATNILQEQSENLTYIDQAIPTEPSPEILMEQVEVLASQNSLTMTSFSLSDIILIGNNSSKELPFTFSVSGNYLNIIQFINQVEKMRRPIKFDAFALNSNALADGKVIILTISGKIPYLPK